MNSEGAAGRFLSMIKRMVTIILLTVLVYGLGWCAWIYFAQASMIYYPRGYSGDEVAFARSFSTVLAYETSAGAQAAFYVPPREGGSTPEKLERLWLVFGGNGARALDWWDLIARAGLPGAGFLLIDYPGYGLSEGKPSPATIEETIGVAVSACAAHLGMDESELAPRIAVLGHSLGAAAGLIAAEKYGVDQVVLLSPFTTMKDMAAKTVGGPLSHLLRHRYDNRAHVRSLMQREGVQLTIIHGTNDSFIPVGMGRELSRIDPERIAFHEVPGADHNDIVDGAFPMIVAAMR